MDMNAGMIAIGHPATISKAVLHPCLICSAFLPASPRRSSVRPFAAKSLPAMIRAIAMTASMDGVGTSTALPIALIGIRPAGTSSDTYLCSKDLGVPVAGDLPAGLGQCLLAHPVGQLEPRGEVRHLGAELVGDRDALCIDCLVKAADHRRDAFGVEFVMPPRSIKPALPTQFATCSIAFALTNPV